MSDDVNQEAAQDVNDANAEASKTALGADDAAKQVDGDLPKDTQNSDAKAKDDDGKQDAGKDGDDKSPLIDPASIDLKAPEGFEDFSDEFTAFNNDMRSFLEANPNASVNDVLAEAGRRQAQLVQDSQKEALAEFEKTRAGWEKEIKSDPEIGGDKLDASLAQAVRAVKAFGGSELSALLDQTGLGDHPVLIRAFYKAGASLKEGDIDKPVPVSQAAKTDTEKLANGMYGNSNG